MVRPGIGLEMARALFFAGLLATLGLMALFHEASSGAPKPGGTADLSLSKSDSPDPVSAGTPLIYTIQVTNNGPEDAGNVVVTDNLPNKVTFVSAQTTQGSCGLSANKRKVTCSLGTIAVPTGPVYNPTNATVTINVLAPAKAGTVTNTASVDRDQKDPKKGNNSARTSTRVVAPSVPTCRGRRATIVGTAGADVLGGTAGPDVIFAWTGSDAIFPGGDRDLVCAGPGDDFTNSGPQPDTVLAGRGADRVVGRAGGDELRGGRGRDRIRGGRGADLIAGGLGIDRCFGGPGPDVFRSC
jgi:uncharacterized repeat protein (TIGR01451 family)